MRQTSTFKARCDEKKDLDELSRRSRTAAVREQRAQILLRYHAGETVSQIGRALKTTRKSVLKWIDKALQTPSCKISWKTAS